MKFLEFRKKWKFCEDSNYKPRSPYSSSKASSDHLVEAWYQPYGLPVIITNCSNNFGPWQFPEKLIPVIINNGIKKKLIPIYGDGENIRDWLFVEDHVEALLNVICKSEVGESSVLEGILKNLILRLLILFVIFWIDLGLMIILIVL